MRYIHFPARYRSGARRGKRRRRLLLLLAAGLFGAGSFLSELGLSSVSQELTQEAARSHLLSCMQEAVGQALEGQEAPFVTVSRGEQGQIASVSADTAALNRLKGEVLARLEKSLNGRARVYLPVGSLTDIALLNGRGFSVPIKLNFEGSADVSFDTELVSAGINQSCHRITMTVEARAVSQSRRFSAAARESTTTVLAETLVVGSVPQVAVTESP